jgi:hypothetical protein
LAAVLLETAGAGDGAAGGADSGAPQACAVPSAGGGGATIGQGVSLLWPGTYSGPFCPQASSRKTRMAKVAAASIVGRRGEFHSKRMTAI